MDGRGEPKRSTDFPALSCCPKQALIWGREDLVPDQLGVRIIPEDECSIF